MFSFIADSRTATPTPNDQQADPVIPVSQDQVTSTEHKELPQEDGNGEVGQSFAKRIVAEILDRSVAKYRDSLVAEGDELVSNAKGGEREGEGESGVGVPAEAKSNYVNYDIAQTVIVSSREAEREGGTPVSEDTPGNEDIPASEERVPEERDDSRTPTGQYCIYSDKCSVCTYVYTCVSCDMKILAQYIHM